MKWLTCFSFWILFAATASAAQEKTYWYKVEPEPKKSAPEKPPSYPLDSLEDQSEEQVFSPLGIWSLRPKLVLGFGFHADKDVFENDQLNRLTFNPRLQFFTKPTQRWTLETMLIQNNSLMVSGSLDFTPSRKAWRGYYGIGAAHLMLTDKQLSNLVEIEQYFLTGQAGFEVLTSPGRGWIAELKAFGSTESYAIQATFGYLIEIN